MKKINSRLIAILLPLVLFIAPNMRGQETITIQRQAPTFGENPIPVSIEGFNGTALDVLKFDLYVQGFSFVPADQAQYRISGSDEGNVVGRLSFAGKSVFARSYSGASERREAHAFADDVVAAITGKNTPIGKTKIAFKVQGPSGNGEIYVSDFDGHNAQAVTSDGAIVAAPAWVPNRLALYYTSYKLGNPDIFYADLSTGQRRIFAGYGGLNTSAAVSPDGSKVAMILSRSGSPNVWVCNADGSGLKQLTRSKADDACPCWSPDGRWICFATAGTRRRLAKISPEGGEPEFLDTSGTPNPTEPDWSPDGKWIAFCSQTGEFDICVMPADGSAAPITLVPGQHPSWAPNSRTLIYNRAVEYRQELSVLDVFTKQHKNAAQVSGDDSEAAWAK